MEKIDLSRYCPNNKSQYRATCYAYAVAYTALSTEYNIENDIEDIDLINKQSFSSGIIASRHNSNLPYRKRSPRCGKYGTATKSLEILKKTGTIMSNDYDCNCKKYSKLKSEISNKTDWYKISDYKKIEINNKFSEENLNWIKSSLQGKHPIIISLYQNSLFRNIKTNSINNLTLDVDTVNTLKRSSNGKSNHVVCILGFDDNYLNNNGYFLIKNNYKSWGTENGFSWIPYTYMLPLIHQAYYIEKIIN